MARKLAHNEESESDNHSSDESHDESSKWDINRRQCMKIGGGGALAALLGGTSSGVSALTSTDGPTQTEPSDLTVGAHYYVWYGRGDHVDWLDEAPENPSAFGAYDARDPEIIEKHLELCQDYGIDWLSVSWWGQGGAEDITLRDHFLEGPLGETEFSIFYETPGILDSYDLDGQGGDQLVSDVEYLSETYFDHSNYRRIDGRPVIYLYISGVFEGDIEAAYQRMRDAAPDGLYIISDLIRHGPPLDRHMDVLTASDAVTSYTMYTPDESRHADFVDNVTDIYDDWMVPISEHDTEFIPVALPGYDDTELKHVDRDNPPLEASPELLRDLCQGARPYATDGANSIFITSFNEWYENTQIEPSERFGTDYLEVVRDEFGASSGSTSGGTTEIEFRFDRTVSEADLTDGIADPRELAVQCFELRVLDGSGNVITAYDVGTEGSEPEFETGAYSREQLSDTTREDSSWRWFGGSEARTTLTVAAPSDDAQSIVLRGNAAEGDISVSVLKGGAKTGEVTISGREPTDYPFSLAEPKATEPEIGSLEPNDITEGSATLRGDLRSLGDLSEVRVWFEQRPVGADTWTAVGERTLDSPTEFARSISGLDAGTEYEFRAVAEGTEGTVTSDTRTFGTLAAPQESSAPTIDQFEVTRQSGSDWTRVRVDWTVSDGERDLDTVITTLKKLDQIVAAESTPVTGDTESHTHMMRVRGDVDSVQLWVNDASNETTKAEKTL